jgi:hypothetical protein
MIQLELYLRATTQNRERDSSFSRKNNRIWYKRSIVLEFASNVLG